MPLIIEAIGNQYQEFETVAAMQAFTGSIPNGPQRTDSAVFCLDVQKAFYFDTTLTNAQSGSYYSDDGEGVWNPVTAPYLWLSSANVIGSDFIPPEGVNLTTNHIFAGFNGETQDSAVAGDLGLVVTSNTATFTIANNAVTTVKIQDGNVTKAKLAPTLQTNGIIFATGTENFGGGGTSDSFSVTNLQDTDIVQVCFVSWTAVGGTTISASHTGANVTVTFGADPGISVYTYVVIRPVA